eukprot:sb/3461619/
MTLHKNCNFKGTSSKLIPGEKKDWKSKQPFSSIQFTPCVARICKKQKFASCVTITSSTKCLKEVKMDNLVASAINTGSCTMTLYKECRKGTTDTLGPGQARIYGPAAKASWSAVKFTPPKKAPLDFGYWVAHSDDDEPPPGAHFMKNDLSHIPCRNNNAYGLVLADTTIAEKKAIYHDKLADVVVMRKVWFHDEANHVIKLAADTDYCIAMSGTNNAKDQDLQLKKCKKGKTDQWTYDESTQQIKLKANTKRCIVKASKGEKKLKVQLKACSKSGDSTDQWGVKKPTSHAKKQITDAGRIPWKWDNKYCMAAKVNTRKNSHNFLVMKLPHHASALAEPKKKDINIVFKKYAGNTKDKWHYNTKHYTSNNNKYPSIVMTHNFLVMKLPHHASALAEPKKKDINIVFKKYAGNTKDKWHYNTKHYTINNNKYPSIVMTHNFLVMKLPHHASALAEPKKKDINIVFKKYAGNTKDKWHYNTKHYTINNNKYPSIVMTHNFLVMKLPHHASALAEPKKKDINIVFKKYAGNTKDKWHYNTKHYTINNNKYPSIVMTHNFLVMKLPHHASALAEPKKKDINIVFKKYAGNTKDKWHYNTKHYTINNNKYPSIVMTHNFLVMKLPHHASALAEPKKKDINIVFKKYAGNTKDKWHYNTKHYTINNNKYPSIVMTCIVKASKGEKKLKVQLKACSKSGDSTDQWGVKKPTSHAKKQITDAGRIPWKWDNKYCMAAKVNTRKNSHNFLVMKLPHHASALAEPKKKDINIVFKKYAGNTKDKWHYNTKHYTINNNKYPSIVMRVSGDIKSGTAIKTAAKKYDSKDQWVFDSTNFLIKLKSNTKWCMTKAKQGTTEGVNIVLGECGKGSTKEKWGIEEKFTMKSASITDIKIMNPTHDAWKMKFGSSTFEPIRIKYKLGSNVHYLYYIFGELLAIAKCKKSVTCGHMEKWFYINGAKSDNTQGKTGKAIGVAKREWIHFPLKVSFTKSKKGKYTIRLDCNKCST